MILDAIPKTARLIMVESCERCPYLSVEEKDKSEYAYCWAIMRTVKNLEKIDSECPLEEIDVEIEEFND